MDMGALAAALASLKAAKDIAEAMVGLRDAAAFQGKLIEFQSKIIDANNAAFAAQEERSALLQRVRDLEEQVARLKAWETEKQRYQLENLYVGSFAYVLKEEARGAEPIHWLCAKCYQEGKKRILQISKAIALGAEHVYTCPECNSTIMVSSNIGPGGRKPRV